MDVDLVEAPQCCPKDGDDSTVRPTAWVRHAGRRRRRRGAGAEPVRRNKERDLTEADIGVAAFVWRAWDWVNRDDPEIAIEEFFRRAALDPAERQGEEEKEIQIAHVSKQDCRVNSSCACGLVYLLAQEIGCFR